MLPSNKKAIYRMDKRKGVIALLVSTTGMGLSGLLTRGATRIDFFGSEYVAGHSIGAFMTVGRMVAGFLLFALLLLVTKKVVLLRQTKVTPSIILGGLCIGIALALYMVASLFTTLADAVFLIYTGPLFCTLFARAFRHERVSGFQAGCLAVVFVGMLLTSGIVSFDDGGVSVGLSFGASTPAFPNKGTGDALGLMSGLFYGLSLFFNGYRKDCDVAVRGIWNFAAATIGSLSVAFALSAIMPLGDVDMSMQNWLFAVTLWLVCGPLALGLLLVAGRNLPAVEYSTISYWECVVSVLASLVVYGEVLESATLLGGALIVAGGALPAIMALRGSKRS